MIFGKKSSPDPARIKTLWNKIPFAKYKCSYTLNLGEYGHYFFRFRKRKTVKLVFLLRVFTLLFFGKRKKLKCEIKTRKVAKPDFWFCVFVFRSVFFAAGFLLWNHLWFQGCEHRICVQTWNQIRSFWGNTPNPDFEKSTGERNRYHSAKNRFLRFCTLQFWNPIFENSSFSEIKTEHAKLWILNFLI